MLSHDIILIKLKGKKAKEYVLNYMARQMRITFKEIPKEEIVLQEKGKKEIARHIFEQSLEQDFCSEIEFEVTNEDKLLKEKEAKKKAIEEAEKKATENAAKKAAGEAERKAAENAAKKAAEEAAKKAAEEAERKATEEAAENAAKKAAEEAERKTAENATKKERKTQQIKGKKKDVLIVINALKPRKISTRYVADALGIKYSEAKKELEELVTMGFAEREKLSRKNLKFYISKKGEKQLEEYKKELEKAEKTNPEEASETKTVITEKPELEIAKKEEPETTEKPEPEIAKKEEPEATEKPEPEITKKEEPEATEKTELEIAEKEEAERRQTEETKQILKLFYKTQSHNKVLREIFKQERFDVEYVRNKLLFEEKDILPEIIKKLNNEAISYDKLSETEGKYNVDPTWRVFALNRLGIERRFNISPSQEVIQKLLAKGLIYKNAEGIYEIMK